LVAALTIKCIKSGSRIPDGIVMAYPALNLNFHLYTPSLLIALDDQVLPHTFLKICLESYVGKITNYDSKSDPLISPILVNDEVILKI